MALLVLGLCLASCTAGGSVVGGATIEVEAIDPSLSLEGPTDLVFGDSGLFTLGSDLPLSSIAWYLDGALVQGESGRSLSVGTHLAYGAHRLTAVASVGALSWSAEAAFTVLP